MRMIRAEASFPCAEIFDCTPSPEAPVHDAENPIPEVCEAYSATECSLHADSCAVCKNTFADIELCFSMAVVATLPPRECPQPPLSTCCQ